MKGQYSMEFLIVMGFFLLLSLVTIGILYTAYNDNQDDSSKQNLYQTAKEITRNAAIVYYQGDPATISMEVQLPRGIQNISVQQNELDYLIKFEDRLEEVYAASEVPIRQGNSTGGLNMSRSQGSHRVYVRATRNETQEVVVELVEYT